MLRVVILIAAILLIRSLLPRRSRRSPTEQSPYMNSLDSLMSPQQLSSALDEFEHFEACARTQRAVP
jgi:hypothetical protein